ncbi:MAG: hypothetical protein WD689_06870 [Gaiellaceae bacterium]
MLGVSLAAVVIGVIFLFVLPWVGIVVGAVGLLLLLVYVVGAARRPAER